MAGVPNQTKHFKLGNLTDECKEQRYDTPLILLILIKSKNVTMKKAKMLMEHYNDNKPKDEAALKSIVMKLIKQNNLSKNFSTDEYPSDTLNNAVKKEFDIKRKSEESDYDLIVRLIDQCNDTKVLSEKEKDIVTQITEEFQRIADVNVRGLFTMEYNASDMRYQTRSAFAQVHKDHIVELQIINKVCKKCEYDSNRAMAFAQHFSKIFNIEAIDAKKNGQKKLAVTRFLKNGDTSDFVDEIKKKYWDSIRSALNNSIKDKNENFDDAMKELDDLLKLDNLLELGLSTQLKNMRISN